MAENTPNLVPKKISSVPFRCTPERLEALKILAARRRQTLQAMIEDGLRAIEGSAAEPTRKPGKLQTQLELILARGDARTVALVKQVLDLHAALLRAKRPT